ncbi:AMP-binding protein [Anaeromyxobacter oryzisoli]|uniref:AMP-binding protein n=1 Tax=Anaeromyxobacter oryzisoli TaxID=2925408 RepID=UPI001F5AE1FF|nr:AMP-binding protein [Anaeromyxobacter sp. SG63]
MGARTTTLGALLAEAAEQRPDLAFLTSPDAGVLTLARVHAAARSVADALRRAGARRGDRVAVALGNGPNLVVTLFGASVAGIVAVPCDPRLTTEETERVMEAADAALLVSERHHPLAVSGSAIVRPLGGPDVEPSGPLVTVVRQTAIEARGAPSADQERLAGPDDVALILFTSGTTGRPKGVPLTHRNLLADARAVAEAHALTPRDVALCVLPAFHINGLVVTVLAPLVSGGRVVMPRRFDAERFWGWATTHCATWFSAVPTILSLLLSRPAPPRAAASLRFARSASAPLPVAVLEAFEERFGIPVIESLGMSEAGGQVTSNPLPPARRKPGSVGIAFGNELRVVDASGAPVALGEVGEVAIRGENVFGGYLGRSAGDPDGPRDGWFRSGDLGRLDADGYLYLTGRKSELINRAGEKIAPREVEEVLHRAAGVEVACVVGVPDALYGEAVAAFVKLRPGATTTEPALAAHCREHLARFKMPSRIVLVDDFPRGPNGKLQRRGLVDVYRSITRNEGAPP